MNKKPMAGIKRFLIDLMAQQPGVQVDVDEAYEELKQFGDLPHYQIEQLEGMGFTLDEDGEMAAQVLVGLRNYMKQAKFTLSATAKFAILRQARRSGVQVIDWTALINDVLIANSQIVDFTKASGVKVNHTPEELTTDIANALQEDIENKSERLIISEPVSPTRRPPATDEEEIGEDDSSNTYASKETQEHSSCAPTTFDQCGETITSNQAP